VEQPEVRVKWPLHMALRVRYHECDAQGIVFNANYLAYLDMAFFELWRDVCGSYRDLLAQGRDTVVAETQLRFVRAAHYDDELEVRTAIDHLGTTSLILAFEVRRGDELIAEATSRYVFVSTETMEKAEPPEAVRAALEALG
jgi:acyl-CoA thioester hydrolase